MFTKLERGEKKIESHIDFFLLEKRRKVPGGNGWVLLPPFPSLPSQQSHLYFNHTRYSDFTQSAFPHSGKYAVNSKTLPCHSLCVESPLPLCHPLKAYMETILVLNLTPTFSRGFGDHIQSEEISTPLNPTTIYLHNLCSI